MYFENKWQKLLLKLNNYFGLLMPTRGYFYNIPY